MIPSPGDNITCVIHDRMGRYVERARVLRVEPPGPDNGGKPRVFYTAQGLVEWVLLKDEGLMWCRGWGDPEALLAANSLAGSVPR